MSMSYKVEGLEGVTISWWNEKTVWPKIFLVSVSPEGHIF